MCARRTTLKSEPLHLADGCLIINRDVTGRLHFAPLLGWYDLLLPRYLVSPFTMALHVVRVYVMGGCSRHVWAVEVIDEGEGHGEGGETVLTNTKIIKQNIKAREAQNHNRSARTTPSHLSSLVEHNFLHLW